MPTISNLQPAYCLADLVQLNPSPPNGIISVIDPNGNDANLIAPYTFFVNQEGVYLIVYEVSNEWGCTTVFAEATAVAPCCPPPIDDTPDVIDSPQELACCLQNTNFLIHQNSNGLTMVYDNMAYTVQNSGTWSLGSNELETVFGASGGILRINTDIIIPADVEIALENITFEFGPQGRFIVQRGGSLVLGSSLIMGGLCNSVWQGIQVEGPGWGNQRQVAPTINYGRIYQTSNSDFEIRDAIIAIAGMRLPLIDVNAVAYNVETALQLLNGTGIDLMPNLTAVFLKQYTNSPIAQSTSGGVVYLTQESALNTNFQGINLSWFNNSDNAPGVPMMSECQQIRFIGNILPYPFNVLPNVGIPISEVGVYAESYNALRLHNENRFTRLKYGIRTYECNNWKIGGQYNGNVFETCNVGVSTSNTSATSFLGAIGIYGNWLTDNRVGIQSSGSDVFIAHNTLSGNTAVYPDGGVQMGIFLQGANFDVRINNFTNMFVGLTLLNNGSDADLVEENTFTGNPVGAWVLGDNEGTNFHCNQFVGYFYALLTQDYFNTWGSTPGLLGDQGLCIGDPSADDPADNAFVNGVLDIFQTIAAPFIYYYRNGTGLIPNVFNAPGAGAVTLAQCEFAMSDIVDCDTWRTVPTGFMAGMGNERYIDKLLLQKIRALLEEDNDTVAALDLLNSAHTNMARELQMRHALEERNYNRADSLRNLLPNANMDDEYRVQLALLYRNLALSNRNFLQLTPTETSLVQTIAQSNTPAAFEARCIRYLAHGEEYQIQLPLLPQEVLNGYWQMYINFKNISTLASNSLQIHPNPAKDILTLNYVNTDGVAATIEWYNTVGKVQYIQTLPNSGTYSIDVSQWANGVYFCRLVANGNSIASYKVIIAR